VARPSRAAKRHNVINPEFTPISAASYFNQALEVAVPSSKLTFRIYYTPSMLPQPKKSTIMVCHHGAGFSALSFACLAKEIDKLSHGECGVLAVDAREHGKPFFLGYAVCTEMKIAPKAERHLSRPQKILTCPLKGSPLT